MKVEYIKCDICGNRITDKREDRFVFSYIRTWPGARIGEYEHAEVKYDICNACFLKMKEWCEEARRENGTNT